MVAFKTIENMNYKIIETIGTLPDLLLYRGSDEDSFPTVNIYAYGYQGMDELLSIEEVVFDDVESAQRFIEDYSSVSANKWLKNRGLTYEPTAS